MMERIKVILTCTSGLCSECEISALHVFNYKYMSSPPTSCVSV